jgi:hypothetical protein
MVFSSKESAPIPVLLLPLVVNANALTPKAELSNAVVEFNNLAVPTDVLLYPFIFED